MKRNFQSNYHRLDKEEDMVICHSCLTHVVVDVREGVVHAHLRQHSRHESLHNPCILFRNDILFTMVKSYLHPIRIYKKQAQMCLRPTFTFQT